ASAEKARASERGLLSAQLLLTASQRSSFTLTRSGVRRSSLAALHTHRARALRSSPRQPCRRTPHGCPRRRVVVRRPPCLNLGHPAARARQRPSPPPRRRPSPRLEAELRSPIEPGISRTAAGSPSSAAATPDRPWPAR